MTMKVKEAMYTMIGYSYEVGFYECFNSKVMPTKDTDYSCHIKVVELV